MLLLGLGVSLATMGGCGLVRTLIADLRSLDGGQPIVPAFAFGAGVALIVAAALLVGRVVPQ